MSGRDYNNPSAKDYKSYRRGFAAIAALFPGSNYKGNIDLSVESIGYNGPDKLPATPRLHLVRDEVLAYA